MRDAITNLSEAMLDEFSKVRLEVSDVVTATRRDMQNEIFE